MTVNTNCLQGMRCPKCGQNNCFIITATRHCQIHLYEDGTDESTYGSVEWEDNAPASCAECDWAGEAKDLYWMTKLPPIMKSHLVTLLEYASISRGAAETPGNPYPDLVLEEMDITNEAFDDVLGFFDDLLTEIGE